MTYKVRGADLTVPNKEVARVARRKKLLLNMMIFAVAAVVLFQVFMGRICWLGEEVRLVYRERPFTGGMWNATKNCFGGQNKESGGQSDS